MYENIKIIMSKNIGNAYFCRENNIINLKS